MSTKPAPALNHPNILAVFDIGQHDGALYIVAELLDGETLRERLDGGALPVRKAVEYATQIAHGLAAAHEKGIVHRDLKPENVFITSDGRVKILDFGLAKLTEAEPSGGTTPSVLPTTPPHTLPGIVLGSAGYMAPEQVRGLAADHRADTLPSASCSTKCFAVVGSLGLGYVATGLSGPFVSFFVAPIEDPCPPGEAAVGIHGRSDQFVDALGLICGPRPTQLPSRRGRRGRSAKWRYYAIAKNDVDIYAGPRRQF